MSSADRTLFPPDSKLARWNSWLGARRGWILGAIIIVSGLLRWGYYAELARGPCLYTNLSRESDMFFFHNWGVKIAGGDWLTDASWHPFVAWHKLATRAYFSAHPDRLAPGALRAFRAGEWDNPELQLATRQLWDRWYGGKRFHQEPLYPYFLAALYASSDDNLRAAVIAQLLLGVLSNVLIFLVTARAFGPLAGTLAAAIAAFCGPLLFYEVLLLRATIVTLAGLLAVYLLGRAADRDTWLSWVLCGFACGVAMLVKATFLLFFIGGIAMVAVLRRFDWRRIWRPAALLTVSFVAGISPAVVRNLVVGVSPLQISSVGAMAFLCSNTEDYPPDEGFYFSREHFPAIMAKTDGRFLPTIIATLSTHGGIGSYLAQLGGKFYWLWHWYEKPNNANFYYFRLHSATLRYLPFTFYLIGPLAMVGLILALARRREAAPLYILVFTSMASLVGFYVLSRFRIPFMASVIPFAALTVLWLVVQAASRRWAAFGFVAGAAVILLLTWTGRPLESPEIRPADYWLSFSHLEREARAHDNWSGVEKWTAQALRFEPEMVKRASASRPPSTPAERELVRQFGSIRRHHARALQQLGKEEAGAAENRRAQELLRLAGVD